MSVSGSKVVDFKPGHLQKLFGLSDKDATDWFNAFKPALAKYQITTLSRMSMFFANIGEESGKLTRVTENLNYSAAGLRRTFGSRFSEADAQRYAKKPEQIANRAYANKGGNGNEASGEGWKYRGRGPIQITLKGNYTALQKGSGLQVLNDPDMLLRKPEGAMSSCWYWHSRNLNRFADANQFETLVGKINAAKLGLAGRREYLQKAIKIFAEDASLEGIPDSEDVDIEPSSTSSPTEQGTPSATINEIQEPINQAKPQYPHNKVYESPSGHIIEVDDTPNEERVHIFHKCGSYIELYASGDVVIKAKRDLYLLAGGQVKRIGQNNEAQSVTGQQYEQSGSRVIATEALTIDSQDMQVNSPSNFSAPANFSEAFSESLSMPESAIAQLTAARAVAAQTATVANALAPGSSGAGAISSLSQGIKFNTAPVPQRPQEVDEDGVPIPQEPVDPVVTGMEIEKPTTMKNQLFEVFDSIPSGYNGCFFVRNGSALDMYYGIEGKIYRPVGAPTLEEVS